jgi:hypothetical protein
MKIKRQRKIQRRKERGNVGRTVSKKEIKKGRKNDVTAMLSVLYDLVVNRFQRLPKSIQIQVHLVQNAQIFHFMRGTPIATERDRHLTNIGSCVRSSLNIQ